MVSGQLPDSEPVLVSPTRWVYRVVCFCVGFILFAYGYHLLAVEPKPAAPTKEAAPAKPSVSKDSAEAQPKDSPAAGITDWPLARGNSLSNGVVAGKLPDELDVVWKYKVEGGAFEATAVIEDGLVLVGDLDGTFYALDLASGEAKWTFKSDIGFTAAAAVKDGRVYVGNLDGKLHCLSIADGKELWSFAAQAEINGGPNFHGKNVLFGSQDASLYCLDAASGMQVWKLSIDDQIRCAPTIVEDRVFLAGCDGKLHIIDVLVGKEVASEPIDSPTGSTPAVLGDRVYFGTEGGVFLCIDWKKPAIEWKYQNEQRSQAYRSSAAVAKDIVVFGGRDKFVHALDPASGDVKWKFATRKRVDSSPVLLADRIFVGSSDGRLYALDRGTGDKLWDYDAGGDFTASPAVANERLVISNQDGTVYCFGKK
jgi:outer membrane protein assembly factor BamB